MNKKLQGALIPIISVVLALLIGAGVITLLKENAFTAYFYLFKGAFGSTKGIARTLLEATPMIFTGLAVLFAFKGGLFNIGGQGQVIISGVISAGVGAFVSNRYINNVFVMVLIAIAVGFIWAYIAGLLKAYLGVHEVISTIMLNYIAINLEGYSLNYLFKEGGLNGPSPQTPPVLETARLAQLLPSTNEMLNAGFLIAIVAVIIVWFIFEKTTLGYEIKAVGYNPTASENAGINVKFIMALTLGISGALAGLAGSERVLGGVGQYAYKQGLIGTLGFDGIAVALLGKNHPVGVFVAAILFGALRVGGMSMQFNTKVPSQIIIIIQAVIILLVAAENIFKFVIEKRKKGAE